MTTLGVTEPEARQWLDDTDAEIAEADRLADEEDAREEADRVYLADTEARLAEIAATYPGWSSERVEQALTDLRHNVAVDWGWGAAPLPSAEVLEALVGAVEIHVEGEEHVVVPRDQIDEAAGAVTVEAFLLGCQSLDQARSLWQAEALDPEVVEAEVAAQIALGEELGVIFTDEQGVEHRVTPYLDEVVTWVRGIAGDPHTPRRARVIAEALDRLGREDEDDEEISPRRSLQAMLDDLGDLVDTVDPGVLEDALRNLAVFRLLVGRLLTARAVGLQAESEALRRPRPQPEVGTIDDLLATGEEDVFRIDGLLPTGGRLLLSAQKKVGKTTTVGNLAHSLLTGEPFLGRFATTPVEGNVVVLNYEVTGRQFASWMSDLGVPGDRLVAINLRGRENLLASEAGRERLVDEIRARNGSVLIVDPFGRAFSGEDQNSAGSVTPWLVTLDEVADAAGCSELVLVCHTGWNGERSRGSTALEDWPDSIMRLVKHDDGTRFVSAEGRDVEVAEDRLDFDAATRRLTLAGTGSRRQSGKAAKVEALGQSVRMAVAASPGMFVGEVEAWLTESGVPFTKGDVSKAATAAVMAGDLVMVPGVNNRKHYYVAGSEAAQAATRDGVVPAVAVAGQP